MPTLIVFGGARRLEASYLRIDTIEQSLKAAGLAVGPTGYAIANALAAENLMLDRTVIADCVNPVLESRNGWQETALRCSARLVEIEIVCGDLAEHRRRVESRVVDIEGHVLPSWDEVVRRPYEPWDRDRVVVDTAGKSIRDLVDHLDEQVRSM